MLNLGIGNITVSAGSLTQASGQGITADSSISTFDISGPGAVATQYVERFDISMSGSSVLTLYGGGAPINDTLIDLASTWTGQIIANNEAVADWTDVNSSNGNFRGLGDDLTHLEKVTVDGAPALALCALGLLSFMRRRR